MLLKYRKTTALKETFPLPTVILAGDQGLLEPQFQLGKCFKTGCGTLKNSVEAYRYFKLAADRGNVEAHFQLVYCYDEGKGTSVTMQKQLVIVNWQLVRIITDKAAKI